jgi:exodeoxyribonuclease VII small subunit
MTETAPSQPTFEQALAELEQIVRDLEDGDIGLEDSLARYEKGVALIKRCYNQLQAAEQKIQQLLGADEDGQPILQAFEHVATAEASRTPTRRAVRKRDTDTEC